MAESDDLMQFFENVYLKDVPYCAICLRSEEEVKLSAPLVFRKILGALKYLDSFRNENICYMCEARASAMARFVDMIQLALEIQIAFQRTLMSTGKKRKKRARENADTYQSVFTKIRTQNSLHSTQVLHVDGVVSDNLIGPKGTSQVIGKSTNKTKPPEIETVIIDDDNPQENLTKLTSDPLIDNVNQNPMSMGSDGFVYLMPVNHVINTGAIYLVPSSSGNPAPNQDGKKSDTYILPEVPPPKNFKKPRKTEIIDDDDVQIVIDDDSCKTEKSKLRERLVGEVVKLPVRTDSRVDWEDMIPMEVIACADDKPVSNSSLKDATKDLLKDLQNVINMGTIE